jgi:3-methyladenine DNA glycosylase/8-oxoguanine DNA glycosylase
VQTRIPLTAPLSLAQTFRFTFMWGAVTWIRVDTSGAWYAARTPDGPGTVRIRHAGDHLLVDGWGEGAEHLVAGTPALVGVDDPGFDAIVGEHPPIRAIARKLEGARLGRTGEIYPRLVAVALAQKVTGKNSTRSLQRIARTWGERAPGPRDDLVLLPEPRRLASIPYHHFHPLGIERRRADLVCRIASRASALDRALAMPAAQARQHLQALRGIGPWTSAIVIATSHGDPDLVPVGDVHLPNWVAWNLADEERADDRRMLELLAPFAGQRGRVARMLKAGGRKPPAYGPKLAARDIRGL